MAAKSNLNWLHSIGAVHEIVTKYNVYDLFTGTQFFHDSQQHQLLCLYTFFRQRWSWREVAGLDGGHTKSRPLTPEPRVHIPSVVTFRQQKHLGLRIGRWWYVIFRICVRGHTQTAVILCWRCLTCECNACLLTASESVKQVLLNQGNQDKTSNNSSVVLCVLCV